MSDTMKKDPGQNEPEVPEWLLGCVGLLVLIIGGIWYWNHFQAECKREAEKEVQRMEKRMQRVSERELRRAAEQAAKEFTERRAKEFEILNAFSQEMRSRQRK